MAAAAVAGLADAVTAAFTRPFTVAADVVTAVPLAVAAVATGWSIRHQRQPDVVGTASGDAQPASLGRWWVVWVVWMVPIAAVTAWELYCFANQPRVSHPTLSALIDSLDSTHAGKIVAFIVWLALGWFLVTR
jgi:hypothetical protein